MFYFGISDIGKKRSQNQDSFSITPLEGALLCTVCDGMGGALGGNVASELADSVYTEHIQNAFAGQISHEGETDRVGIRDILCDAVSEANAAVSARAASDESLHGMGTTLVSALFLGDTMYAVNVGDSRLYLIGSGGITQITHDHSYVQYLLDLGKITEEEAARAPMKNIITRSVGNEEEVTPDIFVQKLPESGYVLLCSDGLTNFVPEPQIQSIVTGFSDGTIDTPFSDPESGREALRERVNRLVRLANEAGGGDNITAVLIKF